MQLSPQPMLQQAQSYQNTMSTNNNNVTTRVIDMIASQHSQKDHLKQVSSLLDVDNLENRVYCSSDRRLMIDGLLYHNVSSEDIIHSYYILPSTAR